MGIVCPHSIPDIYVQGVDLITKCLCRVGGLHSKLFLNPLRVEHTHHRVKIQLTPTTTHLLPVFIGKPHRRLLLRIPILHPNHPSVILREVAGSSPCINCNAFLVLANSKI